MGEKHVNNSIRLSLSARILSIILLLFSICFFTIAGINIFYQIGLNYIDSGEYKKASNVLLHLFPYRDSILLGEYARDYYKFHELLKTDSVDNYYGTRKSPELKYDTSYQNKLNSLYDLISEETRAAHEREKYEEFGDSLPYDGMSIYDLKYTKLGKPDSVQVDEGFSTYANYEWYTEDGKLLASCTAVIDGARADDEIFSFEYYGK